jgi:alpha-L-fucosidase
VVIRQLVDAVSKGGNYLLDVGPTALGTIPQPAADILEKVGAWLRVNGESIYGTSASPFLELPWGRCTFKGEKLYLHIFDWPHDGVLLLSGLRNEVTKAYLLLDKSHTFELTRDGDRLAIRLPGKPADDDDTVVVLEIAGKPEVAPPVVLQKGNSPIVLDYVTAVTTGRAIKRFNRVGNYHISKWVDPQDSISWSIRVSEAHRYQVWITYAAQKEWGGGEYQVLIGSTSLPATVVDTRAYSEECFGPGSPCERPYHYMTFHVGVVDLPRAGQYDLKIRPTSAVGHDLMYFKSITLTPLR